MWHLIWLSAFLVSFVKRFHLVCFYMYEKPEVRQIISDLGTNGTNGSLMNNYSLVAPFIIFSCYHAAYSAIVIVSSCSYINISCWMSRQIGFFSNFSYLRKFPLYIIRWIVFRSTNSKGNEESQYTTMTGASFY